MASYDKHAHKMMFTENELQGMGASDALIEDVLDCFEDEGGLGTSEELYNWFDDLRRTR